MVSFLSPEWVAALDQAIRVADAPPPDAMPPAGIVIQHVVSHDNDEASYALVLTSDGRSVTAGLHENPTVTYRQNRQCASAIASGTRSAHDAFMLGELTIEGDTQSLITASDLLAWLDDALAGVRADTSYDLAE